MSTETERVIGGVDEDRRFFFAKVEETFIDQGMELRKLPESYTRLKYKIGTMPEKDMAMIDTDMLVVSLRPYFMIPQGSIGRILGYEDNARKTIEVEWITAKDWTGLHLIDGFSPGEFLDGLRLLSKDESKRLVDALKSSGRK